MNIKLRDLSLSTSVASKSNFQKKLGLARKSSDVDEKGHGGNLGMASLLMCIHGSCTKSLRNVTLSLFR